MSELDKEMLAHIANIERTLTNMNGIGQDVKAIKKDLAEIDQKVGKIFEKTISNSKDIGFLNIGITEIKKTIKDKNDNVWNEIRRHEDFHKDDRKEIIKESVKSVKLWLYGAVALAVGGIAVSIITNLLKDVK